jgi:hypothetical protein
MKIALSLLLMLTLGAPSAFAQAKDDDEAKGEEIRATEVKGGDQPTESTKVGAEVQSPIDNVVGRFGLGYFSGSAPLGARYWMDRESAVDLGIDLAFSSGNLEAHRYGLEVGYVTALAHYHYAVVFGRAGLGLRFLDSFGESSGPARWDLSANAFLGAELFLGVFGFPNVSLQAGYGLQANYTYQGGSAFVLGTVNGGLSIVSAGTVGFHIYL